MTALSVEAPLEHDFRRATRTITVWNLVSRLTGFVRVVATGAALGATALGDTYQSANLISNILFELLAGGMLSAVLVPTFVGLVDQGRGQEAVRLAGRLLGKAILALGTLVAVGMVAAPWIMRGVLSGAADSRLHDEQVRLGTFLLWFFLPQVVLYAVGAVATALLNANRHFTAGAVAPVFNNLVVVATMIVFRAMRDGETGFDISTSEKLVLALGTTAGVVAMVLVPLVRVWRDGMRLAPAWGGADELRPLARKGVVGGRAPGAQPGPRRGHHRARRPRQRWRDGVPDRVHVLPAAARRAGQPDLHCPVPAPRRLRRRRPARRRGRRPGARRPADGHAPAAGERAARGDRAPRARRRPPRRARRRRRRAGGVGARRVRGRLARLQRLLPPDSRGRMPSTTCADRRW